MSVNDTVERFKKTLNNYVKKLLSDYHPQNKPKCRAIHGAVWGTYVFTTPECIIMDSPLLQRLRRIHQTAFAFYTYPSARHDRFSHSLGTTIIASKMINMLNEKYDLTLVKSVEIAEVKLAALLHDCGHGLLSHVSEENYKKEEAIKLLTKERRFSKIGIKPHEIISYLIITTLSFSNFFDENIKTLADRNARSLNLETIAELVLGISKSPDKQFLADIINGSFDADKIDYIHRDAYFTGLRLTIDIDRLFYSMDKGEVEIESPQEIQTKLVCTERGVNPLEQLLFSKMQLYSSLYHHHKVRASDVMLEIFVDVCKIIYEKIPNKKIKLAEIIDYLRFGDYDLLNEYLHNDETLLELIVMLRNRNLYKRALVLCPLTIANGEEGCYEITRIHDHSDKKQILKKLGNQIIGRLPTRISEHRVIIDVPQNPSLREGTQTHILMANKDIVPLRQYFPTDDWLTAYYANKWRAHVFCHPDHQNAVNKAAIEVLREQNIICNELATQLALKI